MGDPLARPEAAVRRRRPAGEIAAGEDLAELCRLTGDTGLTAGHESVTVSQKRRSTCYNFAEMATSASASQLDPRAYSWSSLRTWRFS